MIRTYLAAIAVAAGTSFPPSTGNANTLRPAVEAPQGRHDLNGSGHWESRRDRRGKRDWQIQITRLDDESIEGRIRVVGSAVVQDARLEGRVEGNEVYGVLVASNDRQIGTFLGNIGPDGAAGTYTFDNGDSGQWNWSGAAPAGLRKKKGETRAPDSSKRGDRK